MDGVDRVRLLLIKIFNKTRQFRLRGRAFSACPRFSMEEILRKEVNHLNYVYIVEQLINGVCQGMIYALMAIGYSLIVGVTGLVTFTYGEVAMAGAFGAFYAFRLLGANLIVAIVASLLAGAAIGVVVHKVCYERFLESPRHISMICTIGMSMLLKNLAQIVFGTEVKAMPDTFGRGTLLLGSFRLRYIQIIVFLIVVVLAVSLSLFLKFTKPGMTLRSMSQSRKAAAIIGMDVKRSTLLGNALGCSLAGAAGLLLGLYYTTVSPTMGGSIGLKAFSASVLGGLTNVAMAAVGGLVIGIVENIGISFVSTGLRDAIAFGFLILVLMISPQGFARKGRVKL